MKTNTTPLVEAAFRELDTIQEGIPFEAIAFLRSQPSSPEITGKILYALSNAYDEDVYFNEEIDDYLLAPLWYAIVAEQHLTEELIPAVIALFTTTTDDWDFLTDAANYLVSALCDRFPATAPALFLAAVEREVELNSDHPYLFMFDFVHYIDLAKFETRICNLLKHKGLYWVEAFAMVLAAAQFKPAIPVLQEMLKGLPQRAKGAEDEIGEDELREALKQLETGNTDGNEFVDSQFKTRGDWKAYYEELEEDFYYDDEEESASDK